MPSCNATAHTCAFGIAVGNLLVALTSRIIEQMAFALLLPEFTSSGSVEFSCAMELSV